MKANRFSGNIAKTAKIEGFFAKCRNLVLEPLSNEAKEIMENEKSKQLYFSNGIPLDADKNTDRTFY